MKFTCNGQNGEANTYGNGRDIDVGIVDSAAEGVYYRTSNMKYNH